VSVTFQKRQKEIKRLEKQRAKAEKRAQKKEAKRAAKEANTAVSTDLTISTEPQRHTGGRTERTHGSEYRRPGRP
jgi:hypothetical protein